MVREKVDYRGFKEVYYTKERWELLRRKRKKAVKVMEALEKYGIRSIVYGSVARGDVKKTSDVDVFIPYLVPSYYVEVALTGLRESFVKREMVQATPTSTVKAHIYLDDETIVSFPLVKLSKTEREFYRFGGELELEELKRGLRVKGVDKRLMMIVPTEYGHVEYSIIGREAEVARELGVGVETVNERVRVLTRRDQVGRTGVFLKVTLKEEESFEEVLKKVCDRNPAVRRRVTNW